MPILSFLIAISAAIALLGHFWWPRTTSTRDALLTAYRCPLADLLRQVYDEPSAFKEKDRFLAMSEEKFPGGYVQCMFANNRTKLYCEAASGYYAQATGKPRTTFLPNESIAALARLGFATGVEEKNYSYERDFKGVPDFDAVATLMLSALHDAYGARAESKLNFNAPFARNPVSRCGTPR